jgi:hypothetical protein
LTSCASRCGTPGHPPLTNAGPPGHTGSLTNQVRPGRRLSVNRRMAGMIRPDFGPVPLCRRTTPPRPPRPARRGLGSGDGPGRRPVRVPPSSAPRARTCTPPGVLAPAAVERREVRRVPARMRPSVVATGRHLLILAVPRHGGIPARACCWSTAVIARAWPRTTGSGSRGGWLGAGRCAAAPCGGQRGGWPGPVHCTSRRVASSRRPPA